MIDSTAKTISTVGIWMAVATILTFGVFRTNWNGAGMIVLLIVVVAICAAAGVGTAAVWRQGRPTAKDAEKGP
jgi:hypothetical protein